MRKLISRKVGSAHLIGVAALVLALTGTSIALPGSNTVGSRDIRPKAVHGSDVALQHAQRPSDQGEQAGRPCRKARRAANVHWVVVNNPAGPANASRGPRQRAGADAGRGDGGPGQLGIQRRRLFLDGDPQQPGQRCRAGRFRPGGRAGRQPERGRGPHPRRRQRRRRGRQLPPAGGLLQAAGPDCTTGSAVPLTGGASAAAGTACSTGSSCGVVATIPRAAWRIACEAGASGSSIDERGAGVGVLAQRLGERHLAEQRDVEVVGEELAAALRRRS